ncbi:PASTA domain-containing penicillin-binding protein [Effusibacillus dendaii]|uniref:Penicillin-binding protein 2B n=1 Tax=Effusibacillus dendaii TaxID=2743772 RepID=A0A7I8DC44_9BACL|nr:PASTA domain-containing penicillin-binding protein [Effusibacillus dendaii]BCJ86080.1 penicillin-binding protein 2B [Effusibacillus dendaii]
MIDHQASSRSKWVRLFILLGLVLLIGRLAYIQIFKSAAWAQAAESIWKEKDVVPAVRGTIYDRNGKKLAYTTVAYDVQADLSIMEAARKEAAGGKTKDGKPVDPEQGDPAAYARKLAPLLQMTEQQIYEKLKPKPNVIGIPLKQEVDSETADKIDKLKLKGIFMTKTTMRHYPNGAFASHLLGFVTQDGKGGAGVELQYNDVLKGTDGVRKYLRDRNGNPLPYEQELLTPAVDGKDVYLTIDQTIQHYVEDALDRLVNQYKPLNASIVAADPNTGEILGIANRPSFDPNKFAEADQRVLDNNRAVDAAFEPGSTFKIVTLTAALNEHVVNLNDTFQSGKIQVKGATHPISDWNGGVGWGRITFREGMDHSSNVAMVTLAQRLGWDRLYKYIDLYGFNQKTGIDLPGEGSPILFTDKDKNDLNLAVTSFGQGISVTPMQQVAAVTAVANGGSVMRPFVMKEIRDPKTGATIQEQKPHVISHVATPEVMAEMRSVMEEVVSSDTSKAGYIEGYRIAGKTGTAQIAKPTGGYETDRFNCSFIGFAPVDNPKLLVYVTVDSPNNDLQFGNVVATPFARDVFANVLPYLGVQPEGKSKQPDDSAAAKQVVMTTVPDWQGMTGNQALQSAGSGKIRLQVIGSGEKVTAQWPKAGSKVPQGTSAIVMTSGAQDAQGNVQVPDLTGRTLRESAEILSMLNLNLETSGSGFVISQANPPGTKVPAGTVIKVQLGVK